MATVEEGLETNETQIMIWFHNSRMRKGMKMFNKFCINKKGRSTINKRGDREKPRIADNLSGVLILAMILVAASRNRLRVNLSDATLDHRNSSNKQCRS